MTAENRGREKVSAKHKKGLFCQKICWNVMLWEVTNPCPSKQANEAWMTSCLRREILPTTMVFINPHSLRHNDCKENPYTCQLCLVSTILDGIFRSPFFFSLPPFSSVYVFHRFDNFSKSLQCLQKPSFPKNCKSFEARDLPSFTGESPKQSTQWMPILHLVPEDRDLRPRELQEEVLPKKAL